MPLQTANLASYLTRNTLVSHGPLTMKGLKQSTACVLYPRAVHSYQPFVKRAFAPEMNLSDPSHHLLAQETCARMLRERKADILLDDVSLLQQYLVRMRHCTATDLFVPTQISFGRRLPALMHSRSHARTRARAHTHRFWSFYATDKSRDLVANISVQVLLLSYTPEYAELLAKYFGTSWDGVPSSSGEPNITDHLDGHARSLCGIFCRTGTRVCSRRVKSTACSCWACNTSADARRDASYF